MLLFHLISTQESKSVKFTKSIIFLLLIFTSQSLLADAKKDIQKMLTEDMVVEEIERKHGYLYTVYLSDGAVVYVDLENQLLLYGALLQAQKGDFLNLTNSDKDYWQNKIQKQNMSKFDFKTISKVAVLDKINGGDSNHSIIMFDSLTCGYCRKVNNLLKDKKVKVDVWRIFNGGGDIRDRLTRDFGVANGPARVEKMEALFQEFKVLGTPNIMVLDSNKEILKVIRGANMPEITKWVVDRQHI